MQPSNRSEQDPRSTRKSDLSLVQHCTAVKGTLCRDALLNSNLVLAISCRMLSACDPRPPLRNQAWNHTILSCKGGLNPILAAQNISVHSRRRRDHRLKFGDCSGVGSNWNGFTIRLPFGLDPTISQLYFHPNEHK